jgi:hypothetical protein
LGGPVKKETRSLRGKNAIELLEEATHLFRIMPLKITALYYFGSLPFILGLLYFVADMSKSAFAYRHSSEAAFSMVLLFLWMKCWQAVFCNRVKSYVSGASAQSLSFSWMVRLCLKQSAVQPLGFIILPVAFIITLPFGYAYAFFQNVSLLGDGKPGGIMALCRAALDQARLFPGQNYVSLLIVILVSFFVLVNVVLSMFMAPQLLKTFLGVETAFTLAGLGLLNTTFFAAAFCITHVLVDPLIKVIYVLRCFYGASLRTGEDLKTELRNLRLASSIMAAVVALFLCGQAVASDVAAPPAPQAREGLSAADLDRSISEVIVKKEYAWRLPREAKQERERGPFAAFTEGVMNTIQDWFSTFKKWGAKTLQWLSDHIFRHFRFAPGTAEKGWSGSTQILLYVLVTIASCILVVFALRSVKRRKSRVYLSGEAMQAGNLYFEDVTADELPADEWLLLAKQMTEKGDLRLALRALYLGNLAHLALRGLVTIAKYKSNRDYERELKLKAAWSPDLLSAFSHNIVTFENIWYGMHDIQQEIFSDFSKNHTRITALADKL